MKQNSLEIIHDKFAPYWAIALVVLGGTGLATRRMPFYYFSY